jgi:membrane associated rhomboid family serine protease
MLFAAKRSLFVIGSLLALMGAVELLDLLGGRWLALDQFGIVPRCWSGLVGIPLAPFLHCGWSHLAANSLPFAILGLFVIGRGERTFWAVSASIVILGGLAVWLFGRGHSVHLGASGLIFGYLSLCDRRSRCLIPLSYANPSGTLKPPINGSKHTGRFLDDYCIHTYMMLKSTPAR